MQRVWVRFGHGLMTIIGGRCMATEQAPAVCAAAIDVGDIEWAVWTRVIANKKDFCQMMDGEHATLPTRNRFGLNA